MSLKRFVSNKLFLIFLIVGVVSIGLQFFLLQPIFQLGFHHDDWILITRYKAMGSSPFDVFFDFYKKIGPYLATDGFYITFFYDLFGENYRNYYIVTTVIKSIAAVAVFPCILLLFKSRLLATLTTLLYATSYSATGSFELVSKGTNYLASLFMLIYFITYYLAVNRFAKSWLWLMLLSLMFWTTLLTSPSRMYPLVQVPILIEVFLLINRGISNYKLSLIRLTLTYLPLVLVILFVPRVYMEIIYTLSRKPEFLIRTTAGDWTPLMTPLSGIGYILLPPHYFSSWFGLPNLNNFLAYFISTIPYFMFFFILFAVLYLIKFRGSADYLKSFILLYFILSIFLYLLAKNHPAEAAAIVPTLTGVFIILISILSLWRFFSLKTKDPLLMALAAGPIIALWFITYTWYLANVALSFRPEHSYLTIPALGISLWLATLMVILSRANFRILPNSKALVCLILLMFFVVDYKEIREYWQNRVLSRGWGAATQDLLFHQAEATLKKRQFNITKPTFIYFDVSQDSKNAEIYDQGFISHIFYRIRYQNNQLQGGCMIITAEDIESLRQKIIVESSNRLVYNVIHYRCISPKAGDITDHSGPFIAEQIYAFRLKDLKVIDITDEVLQNFENTKTE